MLRHLKIDPHQYPSEAAFMQSFKRGEPQAFDCIYRQMYEPLTLYLRVTIDSDIDVEDILATAFLKLYTHGRKEITNLEYIKRWMFLVVRNDSYNYFLQKSKERAIQKDLIYNEQITHYVHPEQFEPTLLQRQAVKELHNLSNRVKTVLQLYFFADKSTRQIAEILQIKGQTVLNQKAKGLKVLRRRIKRKLRPQ